LQDDVALLILRIHVEAELATELEHAVLPATQPSAAHRDYSAIGSRPVPNSPAYAIACLDEHDRFSAIPKPTRCRKTGESRAHNAVICLQPVQRLPSQKKRVTLAAPNCWSSLEQATTQREYD
jgi:hypothetical protein